MEAADVLVVSTPIATHAEIVAAALAARRHVFVEKPLCASGAEALALAAATSPASRLFVGHSERFNPVVRVLARMLRDDDPLTAEFRRVGPSTATSVGVLLNLGVHDLDLAAYLGRGSVSLHGAVGWRGAPDQPEDAAHVLFSTSGGAVGHLHVDRTVPTKGRSVAVVTPRWTYEGDLLAHRLVRITRTTGPTRGALRSLRSRGAEVPLPLEEPLVAQAIALADALDGEAVREVATGHDGAAAVALAEHAAAMCAAFARSPTVQNAAAAP
jgi:predicted dehydrogenase